MMEDEKGVLVGEYRKSPSFVGYHIFVFYNSGLYILKGIRKTQFLDFIKLNRMIQLRLLQTCLETLLIYINLKMETEEFVA